MKLENYNTITSKQFLDTIVSYLDKFLKEQTNGKVYVRFITNEDQVTTDSNIDGYRINYVKEYKFEIREKETHELLTNLCTKISMNEFTSTDISLLTYKIEDMNIQLFSMILTYMMIGRTSTGQ